MVITNELRLATYMDLDTVCNVEDLHNMLEIIEAKNEFDEMARVAKEQQDKANS
ncbi:hypothetical protein phiK7A1_079 [Pseudomonas phage phiK7A1]|uniref:Uncharacterized protein n=1 Tax=Pseudomonas phage phiK7A1 TaxID=2759194 RepID=A0A7H0XFS7_9CAUD|nr:hypothetical protein phiK7A1_079 [Pseudomonas phage phiK7A1]